VVRDARVDDAEAIARVHVAAWQEAYKHVFSPEALALLSVEQRAAQWHDWLKYGEITVLVVERDDEVRAFASAGPNRDEEAQPSNPRARSFYEAAGWCTEDTRSEIVLGMEVAEIRDRKRLLSL
jgi:hypothetical protein